jgi:hypothetical protein
MALPLSANFDTKNADSGPLIPGPNVFCHPSFIREKL